MDTIIGEAYTERTSARILDRAMTNTYYPKFGIVALDLGFITEDQLIIAMMEQLKDDIHKRPYRPLGQILIAEGMMTEYNVDIVTRVIEKMRTTMVDSLAEAIMETIDKDKTTEN